MDFGTLSVMVITLVLFIAALFTKGVTHDLFVEAGVFLVSVKIIMMAHRNGVAAKTTNEKLDQILATIRKEKGPVQ